MNPPASPGQPVSEVGNDDSDANGAGPDAPGPRKRARVEASAAISCELCKSRKVRCDRGRPACGWCSRNHQRCEYRERKRPGLRAGYGKELESRLDRLETAFQTHQQLVALLSDQLASQTALTATISDVDVPTNAARHPSMHAQSASSHVSTTRSVYGAPGPLHNNPTPESTLLPASPTGGEVVHTAHQSAETLYSTASLSAFSGQDLPPDDLLLTLMGLYFEYVNPWCPILHRQTTFRLLLGSAELEQEDFILLHAIVATTIRFAEDERLTADVQEHHRQKSKQKVLLHGLEASSVKSLQALVILTLDAVGNSNGPPSWNLMALITRNVVHLGLNVEETFYGSASNSPSISTLRANVLAAPTSFVEEESRRRLFWAIYLLDRFATVATALAFALDEREINRRLPCREDLFSGNHAVVTPWARPIRQNRQDTRSGVVGPFSYYVTVVAILSEIHAFLRRPVNIGSDSDVSQWQREYRELDSRLRAWHNDLPGQYSDLRSAQSSDQPSRIDSMWIMLHCTYHMTTIRLHSSAAYPTHRSHLFAPSLAASQRCLNAVDQICALCTLARNAGLLNRLGPPFSFCVWVAARLLLVHGSTVERHVNPAIAGLVETLHMMGRHWKVASRYSALLQRVLEEYHESERNNFGATPGSEAPTVKILADMRRCAYDLDLLISRQPRLQPSPRPPVPAPLDLPTHNELEYLDVFDFFNMPVLDVSGLNNDTSLLFADNAMSDNNLNTPDAYRAQRKDWLNDYDCL